MIIYSSLIFSQNFNDKIITMTDTIKCRINSVSDKIIFYHIPAKKNEEYIYISKIKDYILDKDSKPTVALRHKSGNTTIPANKNDFFALKNTLDSIANIPLMFTNSYAINIEALIVRDIKLTYTHWLFKRSYLETMLCYNSPFLFNGTSFSAGDPFFDYGRVQLRIGLKNYHKRRSYISPMLMIGYGHFNNEWVSETGTINVFNVFDDNQWLIDRTKIESGILLKFGWTLHHKHIMHDIYYGLGYRYKIMKDVIHGEDDGHGDYIVPAGAAAKRTLYWPMFELHLGYQIGYIK